MTIIVAYTNCTSVTLSYGIDELIKNQNIGPLGKQNAWALVTNDGATTTEGVYSRLALINSGWNITKLFSPEHGMNTRGVDGKAQPHTTDHLTQLPVFSLYGDLLTPSSEMLHDIEGIMLDLPDVGIRFYTYIWTLSYIMESCNEHRLPLIILDRPNPLGGNLDHAEGPMIEDQAFYSFLGRWNIPIRHCLTMGELALWWKAEKKMNELPLEIVQCQNWSRSDFLEEMGTAFLPPSPALRSVNSVFSYSMLCYLEGTNIDEGRGSEHPFECFGAPWIKPQALLESLQRSAQESVQFSRIEYISKGKKYHNQKCYGLSIRVVDKESYRPVYWGIQLLKNIKRLHKDNFSWSTYATVVNPSGQNHLDRLLGTDKVRKAIDTESYLSQEKWANRCTLWTSCSKWKQNVTPYLLYR